MQRGLAFICFHGHDFSVSPAPPPMSREDSSKPHSDKLKCYRAVGLEKKQYMEPFVPATHSMHRWSPLSDSCPAQPQNGVGCKGPYNVVIGAVELIDGPIQANAQLPGISNRQASHPELPQLLCLWKAFAKADWDAQQAIIEKHRAHKTIISFCYPKAQLTTFHKNPSQGFQSILKSWLLLPCWPL